MGNASMGYHQREVPIASGGRSYFGGRGPPCGISQEKAGVRLRNNVDETTRSDGMVLGV